MCRYLDSPDVPITAGEVSLQSSELRPGAEAGLTQRTLARSLDPPVFSDAAQAEAVATRDGHGVGEVVQADAAFRAV